MSALAVFTFCILRHAIPIGLGLFSKWVYYRRQDISPNLESNKGAKMQNGSTVISWSGIEHEELDSENWVQMSFRWQGENRIYRVFGEIRAKHFQEEFYFDDTKRLAYEFYRQKVSILENGCVYCDKCEEAPDTAESVAFIKQEGFCYGCHPDLKGFVF